MAQLNFFNGLSWNIKFWNYSSHKIYICSVVTCESPIAVIQRLNDNKWHKRDSFFFSSIFHANDIRMTI